MIPRVEQNGRPVVALELAHDGPSVVSGGWKPISSPLDRVRVDEAGGSVFAVHPTAARSAVIAGALLPKGTRVGLVPSVVFKSNALV